MRLRVHTVIYQSGSTAPSLDHHYRELRSAMFHLGQQYGYLQPGAVWRPAMDIHETADAVLVKIDLAGMSEEDIEILLYPNAIVVTGERTDDSDSDEETYYHEAQIRYGSFRADAYLSTPVRTEMASAVYTNGMLRITLPRRVEERDSPDASDEEDQEQESQDNQNHSGDSGASELASAGSPRARLPVVSEPASGRLTYTSLKEISHA
jgi:HSP20 family molecular chaperone IbpA